MQIPFRCNLPPGGGILGLIYAGYVLLASQNTYPIIWSDSVAILLDPILVTLGKKVIFTIPA